MIGWTIFSALLEPTLPVVPSQTAGSNDQVGGTPGNDRVGGLLRTVRDACARMIELHEQRSLVRPTLYSLRGGIR